MGMRLRGLARGWECSLSAGSSEDWSCLCCEGLVDGGSWLGLWRRPSVRWTNCFMEPKGEEQKWAGGVQKWVVVRVELEKWSDSARTTAEVGTVGAVELLCGGVSGMREKLR